MVFSWYKLTKLPPTRLINILNQYPSLDFAFFLLENKLILTFNCKRYNMNPISSPIMHIFECTGKSNLE